MNLIKQVPFAENKKSKFGMAVCSGSSCDLHRCRRWSFFDAEEGIGQATQRKMWYAVGKEDDVWTKGESS